MNTAVARPRRSRLAALVRNLLLPARLLAPAILLTGPAAPRAAGAAPAAAAEPALNQPQATPVIAQKVTVGTNSS